MPRACCAAHFESQLAKDGVDTRAALTLSRALLMHRLRGIAFEAVSPYIEREIPDFPAFDNEMHKFDKEMAFVFAISASMEQPLRKRFRSVYMTSRCGANLRHARHAELHGSLGTMLVRTLCVFDTAEDENDMLPAKVISSLFKDNMYCDLCESVAY